MKSAVAAGATSALMLAGLAFVAVSPASAAGAPDHVTFTTEPASTAVTGTNLASFAVSVEDSSNAVTTTGTGSTDSIVLTSGCALGGTYTVSAIAGVATFSDVAFESTGAPCTLTATDNTHSITTDSATTTVTAGASPHLSYSTAPPTAATIGVAMTTFKVSVEDTSGNVFTTNGDNIQIASSCTFTGTATQTASAGVATFTGITVTVGTNCTFTATDTSAGDTGFTAAAALVTVATTAPSKVGFTTEPAATAAAGTLLPSFAVSIEESNGIPITTGTGSTDTVSLVSTCTLTGTTTATAVAGVATFNLVAIKTGANCTLVASDTARVLTAATSSPIVVIAGAATQVVYTTAPPTAVTTASTVLTTFKASVEDVNGNVVTSGTGATDSIAITSPCTLGGTTTAVAVAGVATFTALSINVTGACVLTATDSARTLTAATATTTVGTPQAALVLSTVKGTVGKALNLATTGGTGTGALSYTATAGSAGCTVSGTSLTAKRAGTCAVTATKAATTTNIVVSSAPTTVTFVLPFKATRVAGTVTVGKTSTVTIVGSGFTGRPRIICNVAGVTAKVAGDTGKTLRVSVTVKAGVKKGVHTFTVILANGKRTSVKFSLR
jgi:hypothetical protein